MIDTITLVNTLPQVFAGMEHDEPVASSEVWLSEVQFCRPDYYMIEAESGTGKSSLCSYIYGSRGDYSGRILFDDKDISSFSIADWCRLRTRALAYLPQEMQLFPELTAFENIEINGLPPRSNASKSAANSTPPPDACRSASSSAWPLSALSASRLTSCSLTNL